jgi:hypothetical protein
MSFTTILSAAGIGLQVVGQLRQAKQQEQIFNYNAAVNRQQAELAQRAGDVRTERLRRERRRFLSKQTAAFAAAGVRMTGSPLQVLSDTAAEIELDIMIEDYNTRLDIMNAQSNAELNQIRAGFSRDAGFISAGTTLLTQIPTFVSSLNRGRVT